MLCAVVYLGARHTEHMAASAAFVVSQHSQSHAPDAASFAAVAFFTPPPALAAAALSPDVLLPLEAPFPSRFLELLPVLTPSKLNVNPAAAGAEGEIGRASCRERGKISVV